VRLFRAEEAKLNAESVRLHPPHHGREPHPRSTRKIADEHQLDPERGYELGLHVDPADTQIDRDSREGRECRAILGLASNGNVDGNSRMASFLVHGAILLPPVTRWHRHLEGWQLAVVVVGSALAAAALAVPRAVTPREIPLPAVDRGEEGGTEDIRRAMVESVRATPLPFRVRAVGEALRRFGDAEARSDSEKAEELSRDVAARAKEARVHHGDAPLLALRAVQADLFARAVTRWTTTGVLDQDATELGGAFLRHAQRNGWITPERRLVVDADGIAVVFLMRWTKLSGLIETHPFAPSLNEWRIYFRTLIAHPESTGRDPEAEAERLESYVAALSRRDPDYPGLLARGILEYRLGHFGPAAEALSDHLRTHPSGPWWLRARNYLLAAREQLPEDEER
jgi:hypothetical protein